MNKPDFDAILGALNESRKAGRGPAVVTDETLTAYARMMMARREGYRHDSTTLDALHRVLEGFGVILSGDTGTGKTLFFDALYSATPRRVYPATYLANFSPSEIETWIRQFDALDFIIDDLGAETIANEYGTRVEIIPLVLDHRSRLAGKRRTHITTNLSAADISNRYGDRTLDRILGMCRPIKFAGRSRRVPVAIKEAGR